MSERSFIVTAGVIFLLIAVGHVLRVVFSVSFVVYDIPVPTWASLLAAVVLGFLAWQGFHLAHKRANRV